MPMRSIILSAMVAWSCRSAPARERVDTPQLLGSWTVDNATWHFNVDGTASIKTPKQQIPASYTLQGRLLMMKVGSSSPVKYTVLALDATRLRVQEIGSGGVTTLAR
jgi:hypothetical protein